MRFIYSIKMENFLNPQHTSILVKHRNKG